MDFRLGLGEYGDHPPDILGEAFDGGNVTRLLHVAQHVAELDRGAGVRGQLGHQSLAFGDTIHPLDHDADILEVASVENRPQHDKFFFPPRVDLGGASHRVELGDHVEEVVEEALLD